MEGTPADNPDRLEIDNDVLFWQRVSATPVCYQTYCIEREIKFVCANGSFLAGNTFLPDLFSIASCFRQCFCSSLSAGTERLVMSILQNGASCDKNEAGLVTECAVSCARKAAGTTSKYLL